MNGSGDNNQGPRMSPAMIPPSLATHEHCLSCYKSNCFLRNSAVSCYIVNCYKCGVALHECKVGEHVEDICPESTVSCINLGNGCGMVMKRKFLGTHLELCPASIVVCSVEWNRWPLHYVDKHSPLPFFLPNPQGYPEQLDIALALRDQAMLNAAYDSPRHFRRMRNDLTERFPAVPLPTPRQVPLAILKERELSAVPNGPSTGGLSRDASIDSDSQSNFSGLTSEDDFSWSDTPWQKRRNPPGLSRSLCSKLYQASRQTTETLKMALQMITESHDTSDEDRLLEVESVNGDLIDEDGQTDFTESPAGIDKSSEPGLGSSYLSESCIEDIDDVTLATAEELKNAGNAPPAPPAHAAISLGVNVVVETITRYQTKPKSMMTFVCGQSFRRNEYAAHYKNVHSEIQGGLTWIEQRCPLAQYGCPFSQRRIHPAKPSSASLIHSSDLLSFGVSHQDEPAHLVNPTGEDLLSRMPDEILSRICHFLDGFALNNFSRVNRRLRFACLSLLEEKGMVHQEWNKIGRGRWRIEFQRWIFSTAFDEINKWKFSDGSVGDHLRQCAFFRRIRHIAPVELPVRPEEKKLTYDDLIRLIEHSKKFSAVSSDEIVELTTWRRSRTEYSEDGVEEDMAEYCEDRNSSLQI